MAQIVAEFLGIIGADAPPSNMAELIPYLLNVTVGVFLVGGVFKVVGSIAAELLRMRRM